MAGRRDRISSATKHQFVLPLFSFCIPSSNCVIFVNSPRNDFFAEKNYNNGYRLLKLNLLSISLFAAFVLAIPSTSLAFPGKYNQFLPENLVKVTRVISSVLVRENNQVRSIRVPAQNESSLICAPKAGKFVCWEAVVAAHCPQNADFVFDDVLYNCDLECDPSTPSKDGTCDCEIISPSCS